MPKILKRPKKKRVIDKDAVAAGTAICSHSCAYSSNLEGIDDCGCACDGDGHGNMYLATMSPRAAEARLKEAVDYHEDVISWLKVKSGVSQTLAEAQGLRRRLRLAS